MLGRWTTLNDFFHLTDRPYESLRPEPDLYQTPYLAQAVAKREAEPIGRLARHHKLRARYDAIRSIEALARAIALSANVSTVSSGADCWRCDRFEEVEKLIETGRHDEAATATGTARGRSGLKLLPKAFSRTRAWRRRTAPKPTARVSGIQPFECSAARGGDLTGRGDGSAAGRTVASGPVH